MITLRTVAAATVGALLAAGMLAAPAGAAEPWSPKPSSTSTDRGDGTYSVPLLNADVPDVSVERVPASENDEGRDIYYMISTTMHLSPGAPIMKSYDLVNWEIVNYVFDRLEIGDRFSLRNGQNSYGNGQWASSLRYHDGRYYAVFNTNNLGGSYLYSTDDIEDGAWTRVALGRAFHDPSLFFDDANGGTPYIFYGSGSTSAVKLSEDLTTVVAEYPNILRTTDYPGAAYLGGLFEGAQVQYIDGQYYIVIITWPSGQGRQVALFRSSELLGRYATADGSNPYEGKGVLNSSGFAQGSLVPIAKEDGSTAWHGMFFRDSFPTGRIPGLIPATWKDGWPTFGTNGSVPVGGSFPKPIRLSAEEELFERQKSIVVSDDFDNDAPAKAYQDESWTIPPAPAYDSSLLGVQLLQNPGAESGTAPWAGQFGATLSAHTTDPASGTAALRVGTRTLNGSGPNQLLAQKMQRGVTYTVSAKVKYTTGPASIRFNLCADFGSGPVTMASAAVAQGQWTTITGTYTVPETANVASVKFAVETPWGNPQPASSSVDYLLDDVSLVGAAPTLERPTAAEIEPNGSHLALPWQWNHAPDNRYWSLTEREGWLRLTNGKVLTGTAAHTRLSGSPELTYLEEARNTLSQRIVAPKQSAEAAFDVSGMKDGDVAGLAAYNRGFSYVAVKRVDGVNTVGVVNRSQPFATTFDQAAVESFLAGTTAALGDASQVRLKADLELSAPAGQLWTTFSYSLDGKSWTKLGSRVGPQTLDGQLTHFMGHRLGLFSYATTTAGGHVDVDEFLLSDTLSSEGKALDRSQLDAAIAHAATLRGGDYPADAWSDLQSVLAKAQAVSTAGSQNQIDAPERALSYQLARLGTLKGASLDVTAAAATRCIAGKVVVTVRATNADDVPVALRMQSASGTKTVAALAPGATTSHAFSTRAASVPAADVVVTATATVDGESVTTEVRAPHPAASCG